MWTFLQKSPDEKLEQYARYLRVFFYKTNAFAFHKSACY